MSGPDQKKPPEPKESGPCGAHDELTCRRLILDYLLDYESGAMPEPDRAILKKNFEDCPHFGDFIESYRLTGKTLQMLKPSDVPNDLARAVVRFVKERAGKG